MTSFASSRVDTVLEKSGLTDLNIISELEYNIDRDDIICLIFLLYDDPHVGLEKILLLEKVWHSSHSVSCGLILQWAEHAMSRKKKHTWKYELVEGLAIGQLYKNLRKLNFKVSEVKEIFNPNDINVNLFIHPMKKALYKVCESLTKNLLKELIYLLQNEHISCPQSQIAEVVLLHLICNKFIVLGNDNEMCKAYQFSQMLKTLGSGNLCSLAEHLHTVQLRINKNTECSNTYIAAISSPLKKTKIDQLNTDNYYSIINRNDVGICYIINQEKFVHSCESIIRQNINLEDRCGTIYDEDSIEDTFKKFGFTIEIGRNLSDQEIITHIESILSNKVKDSHSAFILFILSHGLEGCVYGSNSVPLEISKIEDVLCKSQKLSGKPKIMIIQACQGSQQPKIVRKIVPDGPRYEPTVCQSTTDQSDLITFYATYRGNVAYRDENSGSIFIQKLCEVLPERYKTYHLIEIFTMVNRIVGEMVKKELDGYLQVPIFKTTLTKLFSLGELR